jgi:hypothetical protein
MPLGLRKLRKLEKTRAHRGRLAGANLTNPRKLKNTYKTRAHRGQLTQETLKKIIENSIPPKSIGPQELDKTEKTLRTPRKLKPTEATWIEKTKDNQENSSPSRPCSSRQLEKANREFSKIQLNETIQATCSGFTALCFTSL